MQKVAGKFIVALIFPPILVVTVLLRLWREVKSIPYMVWCDVRAEWGSFMAAMRA